MRACTAVGVTAGKIIAQEAPAGIGNAHCPVDKCLDFQIIRDMGADLFNFFQRKFTGGDDTAGSLAIPEMIGAVIRIICLCTDMTVDLRADFFCDIEHARIRNDQRIRPDLFQFFKIFPHARQILIMSQDICRNIDFHALLMGKADPFFHLLHGEIFRFGAKAESFATDIDRISAEYDCCFQYFQAARRDQ